MGIWDESANAAPQARNDSKYFQPGRYLVSIDNVKHLTQRGEKVVIVGTVVAARSNDPEAPEAGEVAAQVISGFDAKDFKRDYALLDLQGFIKGVAGPVADQWTSQQFGAFGKGIQGTVLAGRCVMLLQCQTKVGTKFTLHHWVRQATPADYAEFGVQPPQAPAQG